MKKRLFVVLAVLALVGCGNGVGRTDTVASPGGVADLSGMWTGAGVNVALRATALWRRAWCNAFMGVAYGTQKANNNRV